MLIWLKLVARLAYNGYIAVVGRVVNDLNGEKDALLSLDINLVCCTTVLYCTANSTVLYCLLYYCTVIFVGSKCL